MRKYLKLEELKAVLESTDNFRDHLMLRLIYCCGLRVGEAAALNVSDVDFDVKELSIQKAKRHKDGRKVPIWDNVTLMMLQNHVKGREKKEPLFTSNKGGRISVRQIQRIYYDAAAKAGIEEDKRHIHVLRHTHAVMAIKSGIDLRTLQQNLGHSKIDITAIYLTMDIDDRKKEYEKHPLPI